MEIKFGTDGWRGIIADNFTFANLRRVSAAVAEYLEEQGVAGRGMVIGYDTRFLAERFAACVADVLTARGIRVWMTAGSAPTPVTAYSVLAKETAGAVMLTASHNPPEYNGFKFIPEYAGPALPEVTNRITRLIPNSVEALSGNRELMRSFDPKAAYFPFLSRQVDLEKIKKLNLTVVVNPMHGAGIGYLEEFLAKLGVPVVAQRNWRDPLFGGEMPEPKVELLEDMRQAILSGQGQLGLALDGDGDRFGLVDAEGIYITPNQVLCILARYLLEVRGLRGPLARTVSSTALLDRIAARQDVELIETPVGFKYLAQAMIKQGAILAGEESGGLSIQGHIPEKDGILACLLLAEVTAHYKKPLSEIMADIYAEYGFYFSGRMDLRCTDKEKLAVLDFLKQYSPVDICGIAVVDTVELDGYKYILADGSWLLVRPSGTEAMFRIYGESANRGKLSALHNSLASTLKLM